MTIEKKAGQIELLAPAGNFEKLEIAVHYGADAVYLAGKSFSLRNYADNFSLEEMADAVEWAHSRGVKVYVACNTFSRNDEQSGIAAFLAEIDRLGADAVIVADPGIYRLTREVAPRLPIHLSTQANTTNINAMLFWEQLGVKRINAAREMSLAEIRELAGRCRIEIEAFVHGAMCISYSGRCLLSGYLTGRQSNRGECTHPCRWRYAVVEETRPGLYLPLEENGGGTYLFNAKDLCMLEHLPEMIEAGIHSLKIEGRMKGIHYLATIVNVYRRAIDACLTARRSFRVAPEWLAEVHKVGHRGYCTGFYLNDPRAVEANRTNLKPPLPVQMAAKVLAAVDDRDSLVDVRNKIVTGDGVEILQPGRLAEQDRIKAVYDSKGQKVDLVQPGSRALLRMHRSYPKHSLIRRIRPDRISRH